MKNENFLIPCTFLLIHNRMSMSLRNWFGILVILSHRHFMYTGLDCSHKKYQMITFLNLDCEFAPLLFCQLIICDGLSCVIIIIPSYQEKCWLNRKIFIWNRLFMCELCLFALFLIKDVHLQCFFLFFFFCDEKVTPSCVFIIICPVS